MTCVQYNNEHMLTNLFYLYNMREQADVVITLKVKTYME